MPTAKTKLPTPGTFIRIIRQPEPENRTMTGLRGWIRQVFPEESSCMAEVVRPSLTGGEPDTTSTTVKLGDFLPIKPTRQLRKQYEIHGQRQAQRRPADIKLVRNLTTPERLQKFAEGRKALEAFMAGKPNPYLPEKAIQNLRKRDYPTYGDFELAGLGHKKRLLACKPELTLEDKAQLSWLNAASERASMWSGDPRVRALVEELDLDPYAKRFEGALYCKLERQFVTAHQLRVAVIRQLNRGRVITEIINGRVDQFGEPKWADYEQEPTHFFVCSAQRRRLPARA